MAQVSSHGRSSRCIVHVRQTELVESGKFVVLFAFTSDVMRNVVETWDYLHSFTTNIASFESECHFAVKLLVT